MPEPFLLLTYTSLLGNYRCSCALGVVATSCPAISGAAYQLPAQTGSARNARARCVMSSTWFSSARS